ncbi:dihydropteroate synthase [Chloroflexota bacterium]
MRKLGITRCGGMEFLWGNRTYIMGIINLDPDSFSGDGIGSDLDAIVPRAHRLVAEGADIIDIGGESTRPSAPPLPTEAELARVIPAIERLAAEIEAPISIDTYKAEVGRQAVAAGASMINDVLGLKHSPDLATAAAESGVPLVICQNQRDRPYRDLFTDLASSLSSSIGLARDAGVDADNIIIDPGLGFGKTLEQNLEIIRRLGELRSLGFPIIIGPSRKSMIGLVLDLPVEERLEGTAAAVAIGIANGADIVRVHDVAQMARVSRMSDAIVRAGG